MKVTQILYSGLGGHGSVAFSLVDADTRGEWQHVLGFVGVEPLRPAYREACMTRGVNFCYFGTPSGRPWRAWVSLYRWLCATRPDEVILHSPPSLPPVLGYTLVRGIRPVVVEHHPNGLKRRSDWVFSAAAMVFAKKIVVPTVGYSQELKSTLGLWFRGAKVIAIPNGIDLQKFRPRDRTEDLRPGLRLGMSGRFACPHKRQDVLVDTMVELLQLRPEIDWRLDLAGDGEKRPDIARRVRANSLDARVTLLGVLDEDDFAAWLRSLDIYVHASAGETLCTSIMQAMACQLPIIGSSVAGIIDLIGTDPPCGLLVASQDPRAFARAVLELVDDQARANTFARAARDKCVAAYANDRMFSRYCSLLVGGVTSL
jgi:glycosyltransferase involved in cell wall biosynthesis